MWRRSNLITHDMVINYTDIMSMSRLVRVCHLQTHACSDLISRYLLGKRAILCMSHHHNFPISFQGHSTGSSSGHIYMSVETDCYWWICFIFFFRKSRFLGVQSIIFHITYQRTNGYDAGVYDILDNKNNIWINKEGNISRKTSFQMWATTYYSNIH